MSEKSEALKKRIANFGTKVLEFITTYRLTIMFVIFGMVVGFALFRARNYSNPARDETVYEQVLAEQKAITIDTELIDKIKASIDDEDSSITENTAPGRTNPFNE